MEGAEVCTVVSKNIFGKSIETGFKSIVTVFLSTETGFKTNFFHDNDSRPGHCIM